MSLITGLGRTIQPRVLAHREPPMNGTSGIPHGSRQQSLAELPESPNGGRAHLRYQFIVCGSTLSTNSRDWRVCGSRTEPRKIRSRGEHFGW